MLRGAHLSGTAAWRSPGPSAARAGAGIVVNLKLLNNFTEVAWKVLWPGRAARLELAGPLGSLDLTVCYFHTGAEVQEMDRYGLSAEQAQRCHTFPALREVMRSTLGNFIRSEFSAMTVLAGGLQLGHRGRRPSLVFHCGELRASGRA